MKETIMLPGGETLTGHTTRQAPLLIINADERDGYTLCYQCIDSTEGIAWVLGTFRRKRNAAACMRVIAAAANDDPTWGLPGQALSPGVLNNIRALRCKHGALECLTWQEWKRG